MTFCDLPVSFQLLAKNSSVDPKSGQSPETGSDQALPRGVGVETILQAGSSGGGKAGLEYGSGTPRLWTCSSPPYPSLTPHSLHRTRSCMSGSWACAGQPHAEDRFRRCVRGTCPPAPCWQIRSAQDDR